MALAVEISEGNHSTMKAQGKIPFAEGYAEPLVEVHCPYSKRFVVLPGSIKPSF